MADVDPLTTIVNLITSNYDNSQTDNITPTIDKIYKKPLDKEPQPGQDLIYVYADPSNLNSVGIGNNAAAQVVEIVKIDLRSRNKAITQTSTVDDSHARKVRSHILKILFSNITTPGDNFDTIDPQIEITDLSNGMRGIFRYILKVRLTDFSRDMTA